MYKIQELKHPEIHIKQTSNNEFNEVVKKFVYGACSVYYDEFSNIETCDIYIFLFDFLNRINIRAKKGKNRNKYYHSKDKIVCIARSLSHEYIHYLLFQEHGVKTGVQWDNLKPEIKNCWFHHSG